MIKKLGHTWDNGVITKEATETEEGVRLIHVRHVAKQKTEKIPATSHHWDHGTITKKATCTENGEKTYYCTDADCNKTYVETIPATGHSWDDGKVTEAATCKKEGIKPTPARTVERQRQNPFQNRTSVG